MNKPNGVGKSLDEIPFKDLKVGMSVAVKVSGVLRTPGCYFALAVPTEWFKARIIYLANGSAADEEMSTIYMPQVVIEYDDSKMVTVLTHPGPDCYNVYFLEEEHINNLVHPVED